MNDLHVFAVNMPPKDVARAMRSPVHEAELMHRLLGAPLSDPSVAELFAIADLDTLGLPGFLIEGHGISEDELAPHKARLAALSGYALILHPEAFDPDRQELNIGADLTLIARLAKPRVDWSDTKPLRSESASGTAAPAKKQPSDAAMSGRIAMIALLVLFALTAVMVWVAG